jgi:hypothetical protein
VRGCFTISQRPSPDCRIECHGRGVVEGKSCVQGSARQRPSHCSVDSRSYNTYYFALINNKVFLPSIRAFCRELYLLFCGKWREVDLLIVVRCFNGSDCFILSLSMMMSRKKITLVMIYIKNFISQEWEALEYQYYSAPVSAYNSD